MKKAVYTVFLVTLIVIAIGVGQAGGYVQQIATQQQAQAQAATEHRAANQAALVKCLDSADAAWQGALTPDKLQPYAHTGDLYFDYMNSTTQVRLAQTAECQAEYPTS